MKWKEVNPIITDKRIPMRLKAKVYTTVVRPLFGVWVRMLGLKKKDQRKLLIAEMSMLRQMLRVTLHDKLKKKNNNCDNECSNSSGTK